MTALVCPVGLGRAGSIRPLSSLRRKGRRPNRTASAAPSRTRRAQPMRAGRLAWRRGRGCTCAREGRAPGGPMRGAWAGPRARRRFLSRGFGTGGRGGEGGGRERVGGGGGAVRMRCGFVEDGAPANGLRPIRREFRRCPGQGGDRDLLLAFVLPRSHFLPARLWESSIAGSVWHCFEPREKFL